VGLRTRRDFSICANQRGAKSAKRMLLGLLSLLAPPSHAEFRGTFGVRECGADPDGPIMMAASLGLYTRIAIEFRLRFSWVSA
jgi:hypothetical protein